MLDRPCLQFSFIKIMVYKKNKNKNLYLDQGLFPSKKKYQGQIIEMDHLPKRSVLALIYK